MSPKGIKYADLPSRFAVAQLIIVPTKVPKDVQN